MKTAIETIVKGMTGFGNPAVLIPLIVETAINLAQDLAARGEVSEAEMTALQKRIADVANRFQDIPPFTER